MTTDLAAILSRLADATTAALITGTPPAELEDIECSVRHAAYLATFEPPDLNPAAWWMLCQALQKVADYRWLQVAISLARLLENDLTTLRERAAAAAAE